MVADVSATRSWCAVLDLPRVFDTLERDPHLIFAGSTRQFFDRVTVAIAATEIHARVDRGGIALEHLFDDADGLEELAPVEGRHQAQTPHEAGHRSLLRRLMATLGRNCVFNRPALSRERVFDVAAQRRCALVVLRPLQQPDDKGRVRIERPVGRPPRPGDEVARDPVGELTLREGRREDLGVRAHFLDEHELQRTRPCPELTHRQWRNRLERSQKPFHALGVEPRRAPADEFGRKGIHARLAGEFNRFDAWKTLEERRG